MVVGHELVWYGSLGDMMVVGHELVWYVRYDGSGT